MAFLCKLTAGLTLLPTTKAELVLQLKWLNDHRVQQRLSSFVLRLLRVSWLNGRQVTLLGSFRLRSQLVSWLNGRPATLLFPFFFLLRPQWVSWLNGRQAALLGSFCMRPQRVSWLKYGEQLKTEHVLIDVQGPEMAHSFDKQLRNSSATLRNNLPRKQQQLRNSSTTRPPTPDVREKDRILCRTRQNPLRNKNVTS